MQIALRLVVLIACCLQLWGCSKKASESHTGVRADAADTNSSVISSGLFTNQMRVAANTLTNAVGDLKEAAGAQNSELKSYTDQLRASLESDPALSTDWQNIHLSGSNGKIVLSGTVRTEAMRESIVSKARGIVGADKLDDQLTVSPAIPASAPAPSEPKN